MRTTYLKRCLRDFRPRHTLGQRGYAAWGIWRLHVRWVYPPILDSFIAEPRDTPTRLCGLSRITVSSVGLFITTDVWPLAVACVMAVVAMVLVRWKI